MRGLISMDKSKIGETLSSMTPALKKEILDRLVTFLLNDLNEPIRTEIL